MEQRMGFKDFTRYCPKCKKKSVDMRGDPKLCDCDLKEVYKTPPISKFKISNLIALFNLGALKTVEIELETLLLRDFEMLISKDKR